MSPQDRLEQKWNNDWRCASKALEPTLKEIRESPESRLSYPLVTCCNHLDARLVPSKETYTPKMWHAIMALEGLCGILSRFRGYMAYTHRANTPVAKHWTQMMATLVKVWPDIYKWTDTLVYRCSNTVAMYTTLHTRAEIFSTLVNFLQLSFILDPSPLRDATPCGRIILGKLWLLQADEPHLSDVEPHTALIIFNEYDHPNGGLATNPESSSPYFGTTLERVTNAAWTQFCRHFDPNKPEQVIERHLNYDMRALCMFLCNRAAWSLLRPKNPIARITQILLIVALDSSRLSDPGALIEGCCNCLFDTLELAGNVLWVLQALEAHLLSALLGCHPWLESQNCGISLLVDTLSPYLAYPSVLRAVAKEFKRVKKYRLEEPLKRKGAFYKAWTSFREIADKRIKMMGSKVHWTCNNEKCDKVDEDDAFKRCEECLVTYYCSRDCQKADWKTGDHQVNCKEVRRCRSAGQAFRMSQDDEALVLKFAAHDIRELKPLYHRLPHHKRPALDLDYTQVPPTLRPSTMEYECGIHGTLRPNERFTGKIILPHDEIGLTAELIVPTY